MKKIFTSFYASLIIIVASSFGHYKQVITVATIGYSTVSTAQFNTDYRPPIKGIFYTGNWSFKDLYSVRDTSADNDSEFRINTPFILTKYNSTRNDGLPAYVLHYDASGNIKGSPLSSLITPSTGISYSGGIITNTQPNIVQTLSISSNSVSISGGNTIVLPSIVNTSIISTSAIISITGSVPNYTLTSKRLEKYSGTTGSVGTYTVNFATSFSVTPNIQANIVNGTDYQISKPVVSTTGFTVTVRGATSVLSLGVLPTYTNVVGANVDVIINEK